LSEAAGNDLWPINHLKSDWQSLKIAEPMDYTISSTVFALTDYGFWLTCGSTGVFLALLIRSSRRHRLQAEGQIHQGTQLKAAQTIAERLQEQFSDVTALNQALQISLEQGQAKTADLERQVTVLTQAQQTWEQAQTSQASRLQALQQREQTLTQEQQQLHTHLQQEQESRTGLENEKQMLTEAKTKLEIDFRQSQNKIRTLQNQLQSLQAEQPQRAVLEQQVKTLSQQQAKLTQDLQQTRSETNRLQPQLQALIQEKETLGATAQQAQATIQSLQQNLDARTQENREIQQALQQAQEQGATLQGHLQVLGQELEASQPLRQQLTETQQSQQNAEKERDQAIAKLRDAQTQITELQPLQAQVETLQRQLEDAWRNREQLEAQVHTLTAENAQLCPAEDIERLQVQLQQTRVELEQAASPELIAELQTVSQDRDRLISDLNTATQALSQLQTVHTKAEAPSDWEQQLQTVVEERNRISQDLQQAQQTTLTLQHQLFELEQQNQLLETAEHTTTELEARLGQVIAERDLSRQDLTAAVLRAEALEASQQNAQHTQAAALEAQLVPLERQIEALVQARDHSQAELQKAKADILRLQAQMRDFKSQAQLQNLELENLENQKTSIEEALEQAVASAAPLAEQVITLTNHRDLLMTEVGEAEGVIADLQMNIQSLETNLGDVMQALQEAEDQPLEQQLRGVIQERDRIQQDLQWAKAATVAEQEENQALRQQLQTLTNTLEAQNSSLIQARDRLQTDLQIAQATIAELEAQDRMAPAEEETLRQTIETLTQEQEQLSQDFQAACKAGAALEQQVETLQKEKANLEEAMQLAQQVVASLQQQVQNVPAASPPVPDTANSTNAPTEVQEKNCSFSVVDQSFVITGKLASLSADRVKTLIEAAGGRINAHPSAKTSYIVVGQNPGNKLQKAEKYGVPQLTETQLLDLLGLESSQP
jgi:chromosome segregation ATPase